jgi:hypothetical protein
MPLAQTLFDSTNKETAKETASTDKETAPRRRRAADTHAGEGKEAPTPHWQVVLGKGDSD